MNESSRSPSPNKKKVQDHYEIAIEELRLESNSGKIEKERLREFMQRFLSSPPAAVLDVGGGPGGHACWLAGLGYEVHLVDLLPMHVQLASEASEAQPEAPLASALVGDARFMPRKDSTVDAVLLFGPMYHLKARNDRLTALSEAHRVLKKDGVLMTIGISRYYYALDGLFRNYLDDPAFNSILENDLRDGQHRNPTDDHKYFTESFFHTQEELEAEIREAKFKVLGCFGIEGPGWLVPDFDAHWEDPVRRTALLDLIRSLESEPGLRGMSAHLLAVGRKT